MKTVIYYFTGTGNSLAIAKEMFKGKDVKLINITKFKKDVEIYERVGFVFPVYCRNIPPILEKFISTLKIKGNPYIFAIGTHNKEPGSVMRFLDKALMNIGQNLRAGFLIAMPGNSLIIKDRTNTKNEQLKRLLDSRNEIVRIEKMINNQIDNYYEGNFSILEKIKGFLDYNGLYKFYNLPNKFNSDKNCNGCGICEKVCPNKNISLNNNKPKWGDNCTACLSCLHLCGSGSIQIKNYTKGKKRYKHPEIKLKDLLN